jgi:hypothetical protein
MWQVLLSTCVVVYVFTGFFFRSATCKLTACWLSNKYDYNTYKKVDVDVTVCDDFKTRVPSLTDGYNPDDMFRCDETRLVTYALAVKGNDVKGGKMAKDRITVMFACSVSCEKLKPLIIGKSRKPRCFKSVKITQLPVTWVSNQKAWMTSRLFQD